MPVRTGKKQVLFQRRHAVRKPGMLGTSGSVIGETGLRFPLPRSIRVGGPSRCSSFTSTERTPPDGAAAREEEVVGGGDGRAEISYFAPHQSSSMTLPIFPLTICLGGVLASLTLVAAWHHAPSESLPAPPQMRFVGRLHRLQEDRTEQVKRRAEREDGCRGRVPGVSDKKREKKKHARG